MAGKRSPYGNTIVIATLVAGAAGAAWWSQRQVPDDVRRERHSKLLPALRRDRITRIEVIAPTERFELAKDNGRWLLVSGTHRFNADDTEIERILTEAEFASPTRRLGALDPASRERFGLTAPRAQVTLREDHGAAQTFAIGGLVADAQAVYVESEREGYVLPKTLADAFVRATMELRERTLSQLEPSHVTRIEIDREGTRMVLEKSGPVWHFNTPAEGRVGRARIETMLNDLRDLRATRFVAEEADDAAMSRYGLAPARMTVTAVRDQAGARTTWRFGLPCEGYEDEVTATRGDSRTVACVGRAALENLGASAVELRDNKLLWARNDEVERVRVHAPGGEFVVRRDRDTWRMEGGTNDADPETIDAWLGQVGSLSVEERLDPSTAAAHALVTPAYWFEVTRTGVEGIERLNVGERDADRMYVTRGGEPTVFGLDPGTVENLRVDAARFRSRRIVRDVADEMVALATDTASFHDEALRTSGAWSLTRPVTAPADPSGLRAVAQRIATLDAERWIALEPIPAHGLTTPRARITARFEGAGPDPDPGDAGTTVDGAAPARPRVREYVLNVGAEAPGGGAYASLGGRGGVFVLGSAALEELMQAHLDRTVIEIDRATVERIEITRSGPGARPVAIRRDGGVWRTDAGAPVDRSRVNTLLERLTLVRAPRVFGYGAPPADAHLGDVTLTLTVPGGPAADAGAARTPRTIRVVMGAAYAGGSDGGVYARREGLDATLSVPRDVADAVRDFQP